MTQFAHAIPLLSDFLVDSAGRLPHKVALVCDGQRFTYAELDARSSALAFALARRGVERGDRVIVFGDNTVETVVAFFAVLKANAVVSVVNPQTKTEKLAYLLGDCRPTGLVSTAALHRVFAGPASASPHLRTVVVSGAISAEKLAGLPGGVTSEQAVAGEPRDHAPARTAIDIDLAAIIYTSGSTGDPKGVMHTHLSMRTAAASLTAYLENQEDDVILNLLPLSFDYGLYQMIMAFRMGARLVLERSFAYPARIIEVMVTEKVTGFPGVPTIFALMNEMKTLAEQDFSSVRYVTNTAAALPQKHIEMLLRLFRSARIYSMYGLTECKRVSYLPPGDILRKRGSVGFAIPNTEVTIVDEAGAPVPAGQIGQIVVRGATVMRGYWEKPEATAEKLKPGPLPGEQVLYTGDHGRMDEDGYLYFIGRMDDIIKSRGEKVAPREVENALVNIDGIKEAAVIGVPDPILGEAVVAYVVLEQRASLSERDIQRECQQRLEGFMVPKSVVFVAELPRTTSGKIKKTGLGQMMAARPADANP
jgi:amino acid adenylation domain-containing protein